MKRTSTVMWVALAVGLVAPAAAVAADTTIQTNTSGAAFIVDGITYRDPVTFSWAAGSQHNVFVPFDNASREYGVNADVRLTFTGWTTDGSYQPEGAAFTLTVGSAPTTYTANFTTAYRVKLRFGGHSSPELASSVCGDLSAGPRSATPWGIVTVNQTCYWANKDIWVDPGAPLDLAAHSYPGYAFLGWALNGGQPGPLANVTVDTPITLTAVFVIAKHVAFSSEPQGRTVLVDGELMATPDKSPCTPQYMTFPYVPPGLVYPCAGEVDFVPGSKHVFSAPVLQKDRQGNSWEFAGWTNGAEKTAEFTAGTEPGTEQWVARFVPAAPVSFVTSPRGLKLSIDGRTDWPSYNFAWGVGTTHTFAALPTQTDAAGNAHTFTGWSNAGPIAQEITVTEAILASGGATFLAYHDSLNRVVIQTTPINLKVNVDGVDCMSPCSLMQAIGTTVKLTAPAQSQTDVNSRYQFLRWSDGTTIPEATVKLDHAGQVIIANYVAWHRLLTATDPANAADFVFDPASPDAFYASDAQVAVTVHPRHGYKFRSWDGDASGTYATVFVPMTTPRLVRALMDRSPYVDEAGVKNAAGDTPATGVAAGSVVMIVGESLSSGAEQGSASPLAQALSGTTVTVGDYILGLISVSPQAITAVLPGDLPEGVHTLTVHNVDMQDVSADFTVVRNAPGLFATVIDTTAYAVALHEDGTPITVEQPAKRGEEITLFATGLGPYDRLPVDGFAVPAQPVLNLVDKPEIESGDLRLPVTWAGAAAGRIGTAAIRFRVADELPAGRADLRVSVNGVRSNLVVLPVE